jgi:hypothetical protein
MVGTAGAYILTEQILAADARFSNTTSMNKLGEIVHQREKLTRR